MQNSYGQYITFSVEDSNDLRFSGFAYVTVTTTLNTVKKIAKSRGNVKDARYIADLNGVRNVDSKLRLGRVMRAPDRDRNQKLEVNVLAGDTAPRMTEGYARVAITDRAERASLTSFTGYEPLKLEVPLRFEALNPDEKIFSHADGADVEARIKRLEQMAGRGEFSGAAVGAPSIVRVNTTGTDNENVVPLIPLAYQRSKENVSGPLWWISSIDWDQDALRNHKGERIRQMAVVTLTQFVSTRFIAPDSAAERSKATGPRTITATRAIKRGDTVIYTNVPKGGLSGP